MHPTQPIGLSLPVLAFTALIAVVTGVAFSTFPAMNAAPDLNSNLRDGQRTATAGRRPLRSVLAAGQMALAVIVLFTAALLLRSLQKLLAVDPGFRTDHLLAIKIDLPANVYSKAQQVESFSMRLQEQVEQIPGVTSAAITNALPLTPSKSLTRFAVQGAPPPAAGNFPVTQVRSVSPSYFRTLGIGLRSGRMFEQKDVDDPIGTFLVNEAFARRYLTAGNPVGSHLIMNVLTPKPIPTPVIGVVSNARDLGVDTGAEPVIYTAGYPNGEILLVRSNLDPFGPHAVHPANHRIVGPQSRCLRREDHGRSSVGLSGAAAALGRAGQLLRVPVAGAGGHRCVRSAGLRSHAAHSRNRGAHGAGRATLAGRGPVHEGGSRTGRRGCRGRHSGSAGGGPSAAIDSV